MDQEEFNQKILDTALRRKDDSSIEICVLSILPNTKRAIGNLIRRNPSHADDLTQAAALATVRVCQRTIGQNDSFKYGSLLRLCCRSAINAAIDHIRTKRTVHVHRDSYDPTTGAVVQVHAHEPTYVHDFFDFDDWCDQYRFTNTERDVAKLKVYNLTNKEVAKRLDLHQVTVGRLLRDMQGKIKRRANGLGRR